MNVMRVGLIQIFVFWAQTSAAQNATVDPGHYLIQASAPVYIYKQPPGLNPPDCASFPDKCLAVVLQGDQVLDCSYHVDGCPESKSVDGLNPGKAIQVYFNSSVTDSDTCKNKGVSAKFCENHQNMWEKMMNLNSDMVTSGSGWVVPSAVMAQPYLAHVKNRIEIKMWKPRAKPPVSPPVSVRPPLTPPDKPVVVAEPPIADNAGCNEACKEAHQLETANALDRAQEASQSILGNVVRHHTPEQIERFCGDPSTLATNIKNSLVYMRKKKRVTQIQCLEEKEKFENICGPLGDKTPEERAAIVLSRTDKVLKNLKAKFKDEFINRNLLICLIKRESGTFNPIVTSNLICTSGKDKAFGLGQFEKPSVAAYWKYLNIDTDPDLADLKKKYRNPQTMYNSFGADVDAQILMMALMVHAKAQPDRDTCPAKLKKVGGEVADILRRYDNCGRLEYVEGVEKCMHNIKGRNDAAIVQYLLSPNAASVAGKGANKNSSKSSEKIAKDPSPAAATEAE